MLITKLIRILYAKLSALTWSINHLWIVVVSLSVNLLIAYSFWKHAASILSLIDYFLLTISKILSACLFEAF